MTTLKNKILIKVNRKLIFIISILIIVALNLFGRETIEFEYYYYTNKVYHSTLKTEIIPSEYLFIKTYSNFYENYYLYNLKTKEKKLFYIYKSYDNREYYDINGNLTTNWTDTNMEANEFYKITNNRFGETFYNRPSGYRNKMETIGITKTNGYIQKAYKYSLTQPEIINKKDRGIYIFRKISDEGSTEDYEDYEDYIVSFLCFQNEYYGGYGDNGLLNYDDKGRIIFNRYYGNLHYSYWYYRDYDKRWDVRVDFLMYYTTNTIYFKLNDKTLIKPTWNEFTNRHLYYAKEQEKKKYKNRGSLDYYNKYVTNFHYTKGDIEYNLKLYNNIINVNFLYFIPIEEFEYYLLAN